MLLAVLAIRRFRMITADTWEFRYEVENLEENENPAFVGLLKFLADLLPEELDAETFMDIYERVFSMVRHIESIKPKDALKLHFHITLFTDETFPPEFSDKIGRLLSEKYLPQ